MNKEILFSAKKDVVVKLPNLYKVIRHLLKGIISIRQSRIVTKAIKRNTV